MNKDDWKWLIQLIASIAVPLILERLRSKRDRQKEKPSSRKRRKHKRR